jgi:hypothetical protein
MLCMCTPACTRHDAVTPPSPQDMRYGFLTYLNGTYFIQRQEEHAYAFTNAIWATQENPTLLEMLLCELG